MTEEETRSNLFDIGSSPIEPGITLIEASAGTGKTYAIAGMVVRLIAERGFSVDQILVVTFTEAATRELRDRVRSRIRNGVILLEEGRAGDDPALAAFLAAGKERVEQAVQKLKMALLSFDEAAIFTIHGFCQRMLRENSFETGALFDVELLTDPEPVWREAAEDFWRKRFYESDPEIASLVVSLEAGKGLSPAGLVDLLRKLSRHPELRILPENKDTSLIQCQKRLAEILQALRREWKESRQEISLLLTATDALSRNQKKGLPPAAAERLLHELRFLEAEPPLPPSTFAALKRLSANELQAMTLRKKTPPEHPFFDLCAELAEVLQAFVHLVRRDFIDSCRGELPEAKKRRRVITFDDLLTRLFDALNGLGGERLATAVGGRFKAALIDEFQDTDPVQWQIFRRVFGAGDHILFLIGDPKQAIYGFRGADIFTYMEARAAAARRFTLGTNWRSDRALVRAANLLFSRHPEAFVFPEIVFQPVNPAPRPADAPEGEIDVGESGLAPEPLQMVCVTDENNGQLTVAKAKERILRIMLGEINRLLTCGIKRDGRLLEPGDVAVLVRTNREAELVREALLGANIPSVVRTDRSVLQTDEAEHLLRLLSAILEPHKNGKVKAALASPLFGFSSSEIYDLDLDESRWQELVAQFHEWQETWNRHGFMRMFRQLLVGRKVRARLLALPDGERLVTNYQHIGECLHTAEYDQTLTPTMLLRWLRQQNESPEGDADSYVIRLEKDEKAVQIVTIHRSKGLEYPVVFCPFNWTNIGGKKGDVLFHDPGQGNRLTWDSGEPPDGKHREAFEREQLAEAARLLYVAVTRARNRCYLFWAATRDSEKAGSCALAHMFGCGSGKSGDGGPSPAWSSFEGMVEQGCAGLFVHPDYSEDKRYSLPGVEPDALSVREADRDMPPEPLVTSFSGLTARTHEVVPDRDQLPGVLSPSALEPEAEPEGALSMSSFPKGAKTGNCLHALLEKIDFSQRPELEEQVADHLRGYRFDPDLAPVLTETLSHLFDLTLPEGIRLGRIVPEDRLVEAPFYFPIRKVSPAELGRAFGKGRLPPAFTENLGRLKFSPVDGYMTGFIDLIIRVDGRYYLVDWKSNWLGPTPEHYGEESVRRAMTEGYYYLQYHLYALALNRHLAATLADYEYERHFGGVFYIFLRGIQKSDAASGIFFDRPAGALVAKLERVLIAGQVAGRGELSEVGK